MSQFAESVLPMLLAVYAQPRIPAGVKNNSTITLCRFCMVTPAAVPLVAKSFDSLCQDVAALQDTEEKAQAAYGLCAMVQQIPTLFPASFPIFLSMVASW